MTSPIFDCAPILLPGPGEAYTRLAIWINSEIYLAVWPYLHAYKDTHGPETYAREQREIPHCRHDGHDYVPAWWLIDAFPQAAQQINAVRDLATKMRDERKAQRSKH